jgi:catechol 2,3-dioxygenase-like lactoylglutathione lyase family enzyme
MKVKGLDHYNICGSKPEIDGVIRFYCEIFGFTEGYRPNFGIDGSWLYVGETPLVHLTVVDNDVNAGTATGNLQHIAFSCQGLAAFQRAFDERGIDYKIARVAELDITQLFLLDPAGIPLELSFVGE